MADDAFPISGGIDPKAFPFLLVELHRQGATGSLKVDGPTYQKALYFRSGRILFGSSNDPKDQLGSILIESGRITPEQLDDVNTKVGPGNPLAKVLAESGFVSQRELSEAARAKVERILADVMGYESGTFEFEDGVLPKGAVDLRLSTEKLVLTAARRVSDRNFVLRHLESLSAVLAPLPDAAERIGEVAVETNHLPEHLDGRRSLKDAAAAARLDEFEAAKIACGLLFLGLVERRQAPESGFAIVESTGGFDFAQEPVPAIGPSEAPTPRPAPFEIGLEAPLDPASFAPPAPVPSPAPPPLTARSAEPDTLFIEPPSEPPAPPPPPLRRTPSDTNPPSIPATDIRLPDIDGPTLAGMPPPATQPRTKAPSRDDLAAIDALLNSKGLEGPLTPLEKPREARWEPRYEVPRPRNRRRSGGRGGLIAGLLILVLAGVGGLAWFFFLRSPAPGPRQAATTPKPTLPPTTTTLAALPSPVVEATPSAPSAAPATLPPVTTAAAPPRPTPGPSNRPSASPSGGGLEEARTAFRSGEFSRAATGFAASLRGGSHGSYSVQLLVACSEETLQKASQAVNAQELFILPVEYRGRSCYRVLWGVYDSEASARLATGTVPDYFRRGGATPKAVATATIVP